MDSSNALSIAALSKNIQAALAEKLERVYWVVAEIGELSVNFKGHCYLELIDKQESTNHVQAKMRATIWAQRYRMIEAYFNTSTGQSLTEGLKILVKARVEYHELYGLSLNIVDIDPSYTVGELARQKQLIINQLIDDGIFDMNHELELAVIPQRLAVISSKKAAGYEDFIKQITSNRYGYQFAITFYQASMQGKETERDIIGCLEQIYENEEKFDAVILIRGGGSQTDLHSFNTYDLAANIAQFPLPVLTGIGHEKDDTIVDLVAHTRLKTPTAVAEFLIDTFLLYEENLNELAYDIKNNYHEIAHLLTQQLLSNANKISRYAREMIATKTYQTAHLQETVINKSHQFLKDQHVNLRGVKIQLQHIPTQLKIAQHDLAHSKQSLKVAIQHLLTSQYHELERTDEKLSYLSPKNVLRRGYSITSQNGKALKNVDEIDRTKEIETKLYKGSIQSKPI